MTPATIFWHQRSWHWHADGQTSDGFETLDAAIRAAHASGHTIERVQVTRGNLPALKPGKEG